MDWSVLSAWAMWLVVTILTLVLYLRVDTNDWGMVGLTTFLAGGCVLLTRSLLYTYGHDVWRGEMLVIWRLLVLVGAPIATAGLLAGVLREPPPTRQIVGRLVLLIFAIAITVVVVQGT